MLDIHYRSKFVHATPEGKIVIEFNNEFYPEVVARFREFSLASGYSPYTVMKELNPERLVSHYEEIMSELKRYIKLNKLDQELLNIIDREAV